MLSKYWDIHNCAIYTFYLINLNMIEETLKNLPSEVKPKGRTKSKLREQIEQDLRKMKVLYWRKAPHDVKKWKKIVRSARAHLNSPTKKNRLKMSD